MEQSLLGAKFAVGGFPFEGSLFPTGDTNGSMHTAYLEGGHKCTTSIKTSVLLKFRL